MDNKYRLNLAGEYRVCSELIRRNMLSSVTMGNLKGADIHIVTPNRKVIVIEVKTTESNRFLTNFFQKYKTKVTKHPDFWVLCRLDEAGDQFFILSHREMAKVQAMRNGFDSKFDWEEVHEKCKKGVDNVLKTHIDKFSGDWEKIVDKVKPGPL